MTQADLRLRAVRLAELPALSDLHAASWRTAYATDLPATALGPELTDRILAFWQTSLAEQEDTLDILVAEQSGVIQGFISLNYENSGQCFIGSLHILPAYKHQGIGSRLLQMGLRVAAERNCHGAYLWVFASNEDAKRFYDKNGGIQSDTETQEVIDGVFVDHLRYRWPDLSSYRC